VSGSGPVKVTRAGRAAKHHGKGVGCGWLGGVVADDPTMTAGRINDEKREVESGGRDEDIGAW
jgi:hypothetical protein